MMDRPHPKLRPVSTLPAAPPQPPGFDAALIPGTQARLDDFAAAVARQREEHATNLALERAINAALRRDIAELRKELDNERQRINMMLAEPAAEPAAMPPSDGAEHA